MPAKKRCRPWLLFVEKATGLAIATTPRCEPAFCRVGRRNCDELKCSFQLRPSFVAEDPAISQLLAFVLRPRKSAQVTVYLRSRPCLNGNHRYYLLEEIGPPQPNRGCIGQDLTIVEGNRDFNFCPFSGRCLESELTADFTDSFSHPFEPVVIASLG
jgi:hypothetical protein